MIAMFSEDIRNAYKTALPTIWQLPDDLWQLLHPLLPAQKPVGAVGRPTLDQRTVFNGILYVLRSGCQWKAVPRCFGSGSSIHRYFQRWVAAGVFDTIWAIMLEHYDRSIGIGCDWQSADATMLKAPLGGDATGPNPTDRAKSGTKRHVLVDRDGVPLAVVLDGANRPDMKLLDQTLASIVTARRRPTRRPFPVLMPRRTRHQQLRLAQ